jgi:hypothetical protein
MKDQQKQQQLKMLAQKQIESAKGIKENMLKLKEQINNKWAPPPLISYKTTKK